MLREEALQIAIQSLDDWTKRFYNAEWSAAKDVLEAELKAARTPWETNENGSQYKLIGKVMHWRGGPTVGAENVAPLTVDERGKVIGDPGGYIRANLEREKEVLRDRIAELERSQASEPLGERYLLAETDGALPKYGTFYSSEEPLRNFARPILKVIVTRAG